MTLLVLVAEINDGPGLTELLRRADAGEPFIDSHLTEAKEPD